MEMVESAKQLAIEHNLSRIIESFASGKDGKSTVVVTIYQKTVDGQFTHRVEKYYFFFNCDNTNQMAREKVDKAKAKATYDFLGKTWTKEDTPPEPEEPKPEPKELEPEEPKQEEPKPEPKELEPEEPKPITKKKTVKKKATKKKSAFKEILGESDPTPVGFVAEAEPEAKVDIASNEKGPVKPRIYKRPENIKYDGRNPTHTAYLKDVLIDEIGKDYMQYKPKVIALIKDVLHKKADCTDSKGVMLTSFSKLVRDKARNW